MVQSCCDTVNVQIYIQSKVMSWVSIMRHPTIPTFRVSHSPPQSLEPDHTRQSLAQTLQPRTIRRLINLPHQILKIRRLALGLEQTTLEFKLSHPQISLLVPSERTRTSRVHEHTRSLYRSCRRNCNALAFNTSSRSIDGL